MSKAMILLEADRVDCSAPVRVPGGGFRQEARLYLDDECKVVMQVNYAANSEAARQLDAMSVEQRAALGNGIDAFSIRAEARDL